VTGVLEAVALALGGRSGARLPGRLATGVSRMTLLRLIRALPGPVLSRAPRVPGAGEFALRRGRRYGTLLVDIETRRPAGILDDRSAGSSATWLQAHPGEATWCQISSSGPGLKVVPGSLRTSYATEGFGFTRR
jgi:hypothetical protein